MPTSATARRSSGASSHDDGGNNHVFVRPRPPLDRFVEFLWVATTFPAQTERERVLPSGALALIFNLGAERFDMYERDDATERLAVGGAVLCGGRARSMTIGTSVLGRTLGAQFKRGGARPFFDFPLGALEDHVLPLEAVWGRAADALRTRMLEARDDGARIAVLEDALLERARGPLTVDPLLQAALHAFEDPHVRSVAEVRARFDLSPKRILRLFHDEVGLGPKAYWRVRRFRAAMDRLVRGTSNGAAVAAALGYADQGHFIREFRAISGGTPSEFLAGRVRGNSDHVAVPG